MPSIENSVASSQSQKADEPLHRLVFGLRVGDTLRDTPSLEGGFAKSIARNIEYGLVLGFPGQNMLATVKAPAVMWFDVKVQTINVGDAENKRDGIEVTFGRCERAQGELPGLNAQAVTDIARLMQDARPLPVGEFERLSAS